MKIAFVVNQVFDGWTPNDTRLGGTEEGIVNWSRLLAEDGHGVTVFQNGFTGVDQGVAYRDRSEYPSVAQYFKATLNHKSLDMPVMPNTHYFTTETDAHVKDLSKFDTVVWPSVWAEDNIPVNNPNTRVIHYGYDPETIYYERKVPKQCLYASSPDRGLNDLLKIWPDIHSAHPDATLIVTYGAIGTPMPGVIYMGDVDEDTMNELYRTSEYWLHPCNGGELFGITAVKAQAAGCWPIYFPTMALKETVKFGDACRDLEQMKRMAIHRMTYKIPAFVTPNLPTWESTTEDILNLISPTQASAGIEGT